MTSAVNIVKLVILGVGFLMVCGGIWDFFKVKADPYNYELATTNRWGALAIVGFGIFLIISTLSYNVGSSAGSA